MAICVDNLVHLEALKPLSSAEFQWIFACLYSNSIRRGDHDRNLYWSRTKPSPPPLSLSISLSHIHTHTHTHTHTHKLYFRHPSRLNMHEALYLFPWHTWLLCTLTCLLRRQRISELLPLGKVDYRKDPPGNRNKTRTRLKLNPYFPH